MSEPSDSTGARINIPRLIANVDTGVDDAAMLWWCATSPEVTLAAVTTCWGNVDIERVNRNTSAVMKACDATATPIFGGLSVHESTWPVGGHGAEIVMGADGLNGLVLADGDPLQAESAVDAIIRLTLESPGDYTLIAVAPFTTIAAALEVDPTLPSRLAGVTLMAGSVGVGGNLSPWGEANVMHHPEAAAVCFDAFGAPGALAHNAVPRMIGLDVTLAATITPDFVDVARSSDVPGSDHLATLWAHSLVHGFIETTDGSLSVHDLLAAWSIAHPDAFTWERVPVVIDVNGGAAHGMTVADRRVHLINNAPITHERRAEVFQYMNFHTNRWDIAVGVDTDAFRASMREWLS